MDEVTKHTMGRGIDALESLVNSIEQLGLNKANTQLGALELVAKEIKTTRTVIHGDLDRIATTLEYWREHCISVDTSQ